MSNSFGAKQLIECLKCLGFIYKSTAASHQKYVPPSTWIPILGVRPFMMVQMGKKTYVPNSASRYISELKKMGFSEAKIKKCLK